MCEADVFYYFDLSDNRMPLTSDDKHYDDLPQCSNFVLFCIIIIYLDCIEIVDCVLTIIIICEISEYVLMEKDKLVIDFTRNSPEKTILVEIYPEFLYQKDIRCLLYPTTFFYRCCEYFNNAYVIFSI
jgi:hypothetical protein